MQSIFEKFSGKFEIKRSEILRTSAREFSIFFKKFSIFFFDSNPKFGGGGGFEDGDAKFEDGGGEFEDGDAKFEDADAKFEDGGGEFEDADAKFEDGGGIGAWFELGAVFGLRPQRLFFFVTSKNPSASVAISFK